MTFRHKLQIATLVLVVLIIYLARHDLVEAWHLLWQANLGILLLIIPIQFISYYAAGAGVFSYLRQKRSMKHISRLDQPKMALELNFVNHILPTAGASGMSYMAWRLQQHGVGAGRATLAQVVRFMTAFLAFVLLLVVSLGWLILDGSINRYAILGAVFIVLAFVGLTVLAIGVIGSWRRIDRFANWLDRFVNLRLKRLFRMKREAPLLNPVSIRTTLGELHGDFVEIMKKPQQLVAPTAWGVVFHLAEVSMFFVAFLSLGTVVNPALILIALGLATTVGIVLVTPGGAGGYELVMVTYLASSGVTLSVATAGVVLARTILLTVTIVTGYVLYNRAIGKYGKPATPSR